MLTQEIILLVDLVAMQSPDLIIVLTHKTQHLIIILLVKQQILHGNNSINKEEPTIYHSGHRSVYI